jgi:hypothetical protein
LYVRDKNNACNSQPLINKRLKITPIKYTTKEEAKANGEKYFYGRVCSKGHEAKRQVADGKCWYYVKETCERRKDKTAAYIKEFYAKNPGLRQARFAAWREKNAEYDKARCLKWQKSNMPRAIAGIAKRKAAMLQRTPKWADMEAIVAFYDKARELTQLTGIRHEVDHIIPMQGKKVSGLHIAENLRVITSVENRKKGNRFGADNTPLQVAA